MMRSTRTVLSILVVLLMAGPLVAAGKAPGGSKRTVRQRQQTLGKLSKEIDKHVKAEDYAKAAAACKKLVAAEPDHPLGYFNTACVLAAMDKKEEAFTQLAKAVELGFSVPECMAEGGIFDSMREDKRFAPLLEKVKKNPRGLTMAIYEPGAKIRGVKTVEGIAEEGLRYRLHMSPKATKDKPNRLIVWMHGKGGSGNPYVEPLAPTFLKKNFALLVFTQKNWGNWNSAELLKTLPAVGKIEGIDARKPVLLCYSLGGQRAIQMWMRDPTWIGGMILNAAYPIDRAANKKGNIKVQKTPTKKGIENVPLFGIVGGRDGGKEVWRQAAIEFPKAGIDVTVEVVEGYGHMFLIHGDRIPKICKWLEEKVPPITEEKPAAEKPAEKNESSEKK